MRVFELFSMKNCESTTNFHNPSSKLKVLGKSSPLGQRVTQDQKVLSSNHTDMLDQTLRPNLVTRLS